MVQGVELSEQGKGGAGLDGMFGRLTDNGFCLVAGKLNRAIRPPAGQEGRGGARKD